MRRKLQDAGLADRVIVDSAGTGGWHVGKGADPRAVATMTRHGYDGTGHAARQFDPAWFEERDLVIALDGKNVQSLRWLAAPEQRHKIVRLRSFDRASRGGDLDVPDPYYDADDGFEQVLAMIVAACDGLLKHVSSELDATR